MLSEQKRLIYRGSVIQKFEFIWHLCARDEKNRTLRSASLSSRFPFHFSIPIVRRFVCSAKTPSLYVERAKEKATKKRQQQREVFIYGKVNLARIRHSRRLAAHRATFRCSEIAATRASSRTAYLSQNGRRRSRLAASPRRRPHTSAPLARIHTNAAARFARSERRSSGRRGKTDAADGARQNQIRTACAHTSAPTRFSRRAGAGVRGASTSSRLTCVPGLISVLVQDTKPSSAETKKVLLVAENCDFLEFRSLEKYCKIRLTIVWWKPSRAEFSGRKVPTFELIIHRINEQFSPFHCTCVLISPR